MQLPNAHLTYCTNIHPGESWPEMRDQLERHIPAVRARVAPDRPLGLGLRLSAAAAEALAVPAALAEFKQFLRHHDLYVFTLNAFPYGPFHGRPVKQDVYLPDWSHRARLDYTNRCAALLAELLPDQPGLEGTISTVPGAFKARVTSDAMVATMAAQMVDHAATLHRLREGTGRSITLALEPEPCCFLETIAETVTFFERHLFGRSAVARMSELTGLGSADAETALRRHLGVCFDTCHAAVEFEDPIDAVGALRQAGIRIAKLQLSAGLHLPDVSAATIEAVKPFAEGTYLHQVVERGPHGPRRFLDLPDAIAALAESAGAREWRIHFHVPIFAERLGDFHSTQDFLAAILALHAREPISQHLEVETYTWGVLPAQFRGGDIDEDIARELQWVLDRLA